MPIEVQSKENLRKKIAVDLRKRGFSYGEILKSVLISKSTLATWLKDIKLTEAQHIKLNERRSRIARENSEKKILITAEAIERIRKTSARDIGKISRRELWLMGIALYWRERSILGNDGSAKKGIQFSSSDPYVMRFFLRWLKEAGGLNINELRFDLFIKEKDKKDLNRAVSYWSRVMELQKIYFTQIYIQKAMKRTTSVKVPISHSVSHFRDRFRHGILRIRVKASSMMARQMAGWIMGINNPHEDAHEDYL